jgi:hypothetical protein
MVTGALEECTASVFRVEGKTTWYHNPEEHNLIFLLCENLKSCYVSLFFLAFFVQKLQVLMIVSCVNSEH